MSITSASSITQLTNLATPAVLSVGMVETSMAQSISNVMYNAAFTEKQSQIIQNTIVTQCCSLMVSAGAAEATKG